MKKKLGKKAILNRLQERLNELFTEEEQDDLGFEIDHEGTDFYTWEFNHKGIRFELVCNKYTGTVTHKLKGVC